MLEKVQASISGIEEKLLANIQASVSGMATEISQLEARLSFLEGQALNQYSIYSCISRPFIPKNQPKKISLDLYKSHTQIPDQAVQEITITIA